jgi:hypothetical protein
MAAVKRSLIAFSLAALACAAASAQTTVYTTNAAFLAMVAPGSYLETFTQVAVDSGPSFTYSGGGFSYTVTADNGASTVYRSGTIIGNNLPDLSLTLTFTTGNVTAVGGEFFTTNISDIFQAAAVTLTLNNGTVVNYTPTSQTNSFRGFTTPVPILSLTMSAPGPSLYNSIDNLRVGAVVPEPGTYAMMGLGLLAARRLRSRE